MTNITFDQATTFDVIDFLSQRQPAYVCRIDGVPVAIAGVMRRGGGTDDQWWAYFDVRGRPGPEAGIRIVRFMRQHLKAFNQPVLIQAGHYRYQQAPRLLRAVGFEPTGEREGIMEIWKWTPSPS